MNEEDVTEPIVALLDDLLGRCTFPPAGSRVDLAVSGGPDSVAMLVLGMHAGLAATAVHVDHGLRDRSDDEASFVESVARRFGAAFRSERITVTPGANLEARARQARYDVLGPDALIGHTLDDRAETVLINLLRGAGAEGLSAMHPPDPRRPLLALRRRETQAVCSELQIEAFVDPSNVDPRFVRNRIRHELLPLMNDIAGRDVAELLARTADHLAADAAALSQIAAGVDPTDVRALRTLDPPVAARVIRRWLSERLEGYPPDAATVARVMSVVRGDAVATEAPGGWRIARRAGLLRIEAPRTVQ